MIFSWPFQVYNVADKLQISIGTADKGSRIKRESRAELTQDGAGNYLITYHPTHNFLQKSNSNYFCLEGTMRVRYEWQDGDVFKQEHSDIYKTLMQEHNAALNLDDNWEEGEGWIQNTAEKKFAANYWRPSLVPYEPVSATAEVVAMTDNTTLLCPMQYVTGWTFETVDILPTKSVISTKQGDEQYIIFGQNCKIGDTSIPKHSIKKQTSDSVTILSDSEQVTALVRIYK